MRILFISGELIGSAIVHKLVDEGHDVKLFIQHRDRRECLDGFVEKTKDWRSELNWVGRDGLIIFDDVIFDGAQDELRAQGFKVVGGNAASDKLELDRQHFHDTLAEHGVATIPSFDFPTARDAILFVEENPDAWVVKQSSHIGMLSYVGKREDAKDTLDVLRLYEERDIAPVHLQKRVYGIELGVGRYFNGFDWVGPIEINLEHKPLCNDNVGPLTAEMGTIMWYESDEKNKLFQAVLAPIRKHLRAINFVGDIDINCIVNSEGVWPLEATMRFGTPSTELHCHMHLSPWGEFLYALANGKPYDLKYRREFGMVISVMLPPFPYAPEYFDDMRIENCKGLSVLFDDDLSASERQQIHFEEVARISNPDGSERYQIAGKHGYALYVTSHGDTVQQAKDSAHRVIDKITLPKMIYRTDIGDEFQRWQKDQLVDWGFMG